ncbi:amino acid permease [Roseiarcaceae bacterium H3SJ34-1]|uniref:APC family permease n=1 Tax=Terripilifer ovatus TaxID=3032367 RepID=UPI003AB96265|nr:amino acid permease [Roseiarcaceae bacterium H3SJ34-1]
MSSGSANEPLPTLQRRLGLPLLVLYGTGITIGAGIYVLIGTVAGHAGVYAPWSFLIAAVVMAFTVASYAELSTRFPVSAGEAAYVKEAFHSRILSILTGLLTIGIGVISSAAVAIGSAGYIGQFIDWPGGLIVVFVVAMLSAVAAWGILESVLLASVFTLMEVGGLLIIILAGLRSDLQIAGAFIQPIPLDAQVLSGIAFASLLAFFAFIGFEDLVNVVEEVKVPHRDLPRAMALTLGVSAILYILVAAIAIIAVPPAELSLSPAPLSLVFNKVAGASPVLISTIAIVATLNTVLAQITMATRVIYGMAGQGDLPAILGKIDRRTKTPLIATGVIAVLVAGLALNVSLERLAESTSLGTLVVFALVNLSLLQLRYRNVPSKERHVSVPLWVPACGLVTSVAMLGTTLFG